MENIPDIYPISPLIDLEQEHIYNDYTLIPRSNIPNLFPNTIFFSREQDQKYPWTQLVIFLTIYVINLQRTKCC